MRLGRVWRDERGTLIERTIAVAFIPIPAPHGRQARRT